MQEYSPQTTFPSLETQELHKSTNFELIDYFELFFDDDIINHLCIQTNLYAKQFQDSNNLK